MRVWFKARLGRCHQFYAALWCDWYGSWNFGCEVSVHTTFTFFTFGMFKNSEFGGYLVTSSLTQILVYINCCRECQQRRIHCWLWVKARISRMLESWKHNPPVSTGLIFSCLAESWAVFLLKRLLHISIIYQHPFRFDLATSLGKL